MTIRLQEVVRSEVEGGLSGPANPIPSQSIDCGCGQLPCPRLAKYATRRLFVGLLCGVGTLQAAAGAYFNVTGPTIARRFNLDPYLIDWILVASDLTPFVLGLAVAYWGDRIHRASWIGSFVLLQSVAYFALIIPHFTHRARVIEETENVTHMSLYADDSPELCAAGSSRIVNEENEPCYLTAALLIGVQIFAGMANVAYYALGISYLDDNTKKRHVAAFIGVVLAVKVVGVLLGYILAWGCLRIDAQSLTVVESYQEQIGAWWLGFPILSILLFVPALLLSWFPRRLPSEVVEQAAASLLGRGGRYNRGPRRTISQKVGSASFWPSLSRIVANRTLMCNVLAYVFCATALLNFAVHENTILEARFHVPRPTGMLLGFGDPLLSRLISSIVKPVLVGLIVIISGLVIAKGRPSARFLAGYSFVVVIIAGVIIFSLIFATCDKPSVVGMGKGSVSLLKYCNKDCRCSKDADFRPVCDSKGKFTFYSPCHAGCRSSEYVNDVKIYSGCSCVEEMTGMGNIQAKDGPCASNGCQIGWLTFEYGTALVFVLIASTLVGDLLIGLRSVYKQDKAIGIGFSIAWLALFVHVPGKILYQTVSDLTCRHWGVKRSMCHLHDSEDLGDYLCYLTVLLLAVSAVFKALVWLFCGEMPVYNQSEVLATGTEMQTLVQPASSSRAEQSEGATADSASPPEASATMEAESAESAAPNATARNEARSNEDEKPAEGEDTKEGGSEARDTRLKYGPLGPGDRRNERDASASRKPRARGQRVRNLDSDDEPFTSSDESNKGASPKVSYRPLEIDSDVESDLGSTGPRSRKRVLSKDYDQASPDKREPDRVAETATGKPEFPNPDHYGDPRHHRKDSKDRNGHADGSSNTDSFEYARRKRDDGVQRAGDFNEVGIPIVEPSTSLRAETGGSNGRFLKDVKSLIDRYELNASQECIDDRESVKSNESARMKLGSRIPAIPLVAMVPGRPASRARSSSGFESLPDAHEKGADSTMGSRGTPSPSHSDGSSKRALWTDL